MKVTLRPFRVAQMLDTEERRLSYLNTVLKDGDIAEIRRAFRHVAESKGIELPSLEGEFWVLEALKKLGLGLQSLEMQEGHTA